MILLGRYLEEALRDMEKNRVHFVFFGDLSRLSPELQELCRNAEARSREYHEVQVNFCLNYGGRDEILRAARRFAQAVANGEQEPDQLDESLFSRYLYSAGVPDPSDHSALRGEADQQFPPVAVGLFGVCIPGCALAGLQSQGPGRGHCRIPPAQPPVWRCLNI